MFKAIDNSSKWVSWSFMLCQQLNYLTARAQSEAGSLMIHDNIIQVVSPGEFYQQLLWDLNATEDKSFCNSSWPMAWGHSTYTNDINQDVTCNRIHTELLQVVNKITSHSVWSSFSTVHKAVLKLQHFVYVTMGNAASFTSIFLVLLLVRHL